jgi:3-oxoacyl-(acyl-carrier-protein) synthase
VPHTAKSKAVQYAINNTFGFGGHNVSLVFKRV